MVIITAIVAAFLTMLLSASHKNLPAATVTLYVYVGLVSYWCVTRLSERK